ncbi:hypothetical protein CYY_010440, partial [Polysphondylium violaceum]
MKIRFEFLLIYFFIFGVFCQIQTITWNAPSGLFSDASKWQPNVVPNSDQIAMIDNGGTVEATSPIAVFSLAVDLGSTLTTFDSTHAQNMILVDRNAILNLFRDDIQFYVMKNYAQVNLKGHSGYTQLDNYHELNIKGKPNLVGPLIQNFYNMTVYFSSPTFYGEVNNFGSMEILGTKENTTTFDDYYAGSTSDLFIINTNIGFNKGFILLDSFSLIESSYIDAKNITFKNNSIVYIQNSKFEAFGFLLSNYTSLNIFTSNCTFGGNLGDESMFLVINTITNIQESNFTFQDKKISVLGKVPGKLFSNQLVWSKGSKVLFNNTGFVLSDNPLLAVYGESEFNFVGGNFLAQNETVILCDNSTITLFSPRVTNNAFYIRHNSMVLLLNSSKILLNGLMVFTENGNLNVENSVLWLMGEVQMMDDSVLSFKNSREISLIYGNLRLLDRAFINSDSSFIAIWGKIHLKGETDIRLKKSTLIVPGEILMEKDSFFYANHSNIYVNGTVNSYGTLNALDIFFNVEGKVNFYNNFAIFKDSDIRIKGDLNMYSNQTNLFDSIFTLINTTTVVSNNLKISGSLFVATNSTIEIHGRFIYESGTIFLFNSGFRNRVGGLLDTTSNIEIDSNSTFVNQGTILLSSNIIPSNSTQSVDMLMVENSGVINVVRDGSNITIPLLNTGEFNLGNKTIYVEQYSQNLGMLLLKGGFINSDKDIV